MSSELAGRTIAHYRLTAKLGAGGMGEVWHAVDLQLGREVAIKLLPEGFARDPERLARSEREAKLLAQLNHPHIAQIYGLVTSGETHALVIELVAGPTLAERLDSGPLPTREALSLARQIAGALEEAHEKGIVHRDLKPQNIKASEEGVVKVLDFGLAKAFAPTAAAELSPSDLAHSPTLTLGGTREGVILGTAAYMAPEQAKGLAVGKRADIWAFGVVLFEMLTGRSLFAGDSVADTLSRVLRHEVAFDSLPSDVPPAIRRLLRRCLERNPKNRLHDIADARLVLDDTLEGRDSPDPAVPPATETGRSRSLAWALAAVAVGALATLAVVLASRPRSAPRLRGRFEINLPEGEQLDAWYRRAVAISPDGNTLAMITSSVAHPPAPLGSDARRIETRALDGESFRPVIGTEGAVELAFSPDGRWLAFAAFTGFRPGDPNYGELRKVPIEGGRPVTLCRCQNGWGLAWGPGDRLVFAGQRGPIWSVSASGGTPEALTRIDDDESEASHHHPRLLPDGRTLLFAATGTQGRGGTASFKLFAQRLGEKRRVLIADAATDPRFLAPNHLIFARDGTLFQARFEPGRPEPSDSPAPLVEGVAHSIAIGTTSAESAEAQYDISASGLLVSAPGSIAAPSTSQLVWADSSGRLTPLDLPAGPYLAVRLSPDGRRVLLSLLYPGRQVELYDLERETLSRATFGATPENAIWEPGAKRITFSSTHEGFAALYSQAIDAPGRPMERLTTSRFAFVEPSAWTPDGKDLLFTKLTPTGAIIEAMTRGAAPRGLLGDPRSSGPGRQFAFPEPSPDGRWLAYVSDQSGVMQVWARPLAREGAEQQVSVQGGSEPAWSRDGGAIVYHDLPGGRPAGSPTTYYRVEAAVDGDQLRLGQPQALFSGVFVTPGPTRGYDIAPDGRLLLIHPTEISPAEQAANDALLFPKHLHVVIGGIDELSSRPDS